VKKLCLAPGPTKVHDELAHWLSDAWDEGVMWRSHRSSWFQGLYQKVDTGLRELLGIPEGHRIGFLTSANEAWWRSAGVGSGPVAAWVGGEFSRRWAMALQASGRDVQATDFGPDYSQSFHVSGSPTALALVMNETSTGFAVPTDSVLALASAHPEALLLLDVVSAVPYAQVPWECTDIAFWSVQKGFCLPAGLAVVVMSPRAAEQANSGGFHAVERLWADSGKWQTTETPNVLGVYLLSRAVEKYVTQGIDVIRRETSERAARLYAGLASTPFEPLVSDPRYRSKTVVAIRADFEVEPLRKRLIDQHGVYLGACYDEFKPNCLRIANFPSHTEEDHARVLRLLGS
jgi:phosphoserine aminotransferase